MQKGKLQTVYSWLRERPDKRVIFVSGVHRCGTNMMMETLEWHPRTDVYRESDPRAFKHFMMLPESAITELIERSPADRVVIKALHEAEKLAGLLDRHAPARAIWMYRDWRDVVNSILARWPNHRNGIDEIVQAIDTVKWRGRGTTDTTRTILKEVYRPDIDDASANALFWYLRNQLFFDQGFDDDDRVALINYDRLLERPEPQLRALCTMLEIELVPRMTRVCDVRQVRKKPPPSVEPEVASLADEMLERLRNVWLASPFGRAG
jgi:hypothetical protein